MLAAILVKHTSEAQIRVAVRTFWSYQVAGLRALVAGSFEPLIRGGELIARFGLPRPCATSRPSAQFLGVARAVQRGGPRATHEQDVQPGAALTASLRVEHRLSSAAAPGSAA